jgi:predicted outer membrane repeat protein
MNMKTVLAGLLLSGLLVSGAGAATITVDWSDPGGYMTIQEGIDAASGCDTVLVLPGTYVGEGNRDLDFGGKNLVLVSDGGYTVTTIACGGAARGFWFHSGEDTISVVMGFTVSGAAADSGAGALCENASSPRFEECLFQGNTAQNLGGGICCTGSSPIVRGCRFEMNTADQDGDPDGLGGGMACFDGSASLIEDTEFTANQARFGGGGLYLDYSPASVVGCTFTGNNILAYGNEGAGAAAGFADGCSFTGCTFTGNGDASVVVGAGLHVAATNITVAECDFFDNTAGQSGGAHFNYGSSGTVSGCTFAGNLGTWGACGGISCVSGSNITITNCTFCDNQDYNIWCADASPTIEYSILAFGVPGGAVNCDLGTETPHIHHCFACSNAGDDTLCGNFHDIVKSDPLFCDRLNKKFSLCANSPCLPGVTWTSLVGAHGADCPACESAVEPSSWGAIKATYR